MQLSLNCVHKAVLQTHTVHLSKSPHCCEDPRRTHLVLLDSPGQRSELTRGNTILRVASETTDLFTLGASWMCADRFLIPSPSSCVSRAGCQRHTSRQKALPASPLLRRSPGSVPDRRDPTSALGHRGDAHTHTQRPRRS